MASSVQSAVAVATGAVSAYYLREYFKGGQCRSQARMDGKTVVITGCNTGIGKETVLDMSRRGARVVMACRNLELANKAADEIRSETNGAVQVYRLDLASLKSVRECAEAIKANEARIDVLINNAGVMMCPYQKTDDGFEMQMGTNHFGHFLFTNLLLDKIKASAPARIVTVSSRAHEKGQIDLADLNWETRTYSTLAAYQQSKLANVLFTRELARRLKDTGVTCYALHPGLVRTELGRHIEDKIGSVLAKLLWGGIYFFTKDPKEGAQTSIFCAVDESVKDQTGLYYSDCAVKQLLPHAQDDEKTKELWKLSEEAVGM